ncbi:MAG TPA: hypothetical protein VK427_19920 [Kofleriaceae bacterium]|nr:hypothetical protein [Kofleriaceae bacterium]
MRILFVENHATLAELVVARFLAAHIVEIVPSLAAARARLATPYDAILVDYDLDDGKGDVLVRELRAAGTTAKLVGISARDAGNEALVAAGVDAVCPKLELARIGDVLG